MIMAITIKNIPVLEVLRQKILCVVLTRTL